MASKKNGTLYTGVTNDLKRRVYEHKDGTVKGFTEKYSVATLVYFEQGVDIRSAIAREKQLKNWKREWKIDLIESLNPYWLDLADKLFE